MSDASEEVKISKRTVVMTDLHGAVSGNFSVRLSQGLGEVLDPNTGKWVAIGNVQGDQPRQWDSVADLAKAIEDNIDKKDAAGNTVPFEA